MSRSSYVYIIVGEATRIPQAAFTVKHELVAWLRKRNGLSMLRLFRVPDGNAYVTTGTLEIDINWLLANPTATIKE